MADIFSCLWEGTPGLVGQHLEDFGVSARDKISPMSDLDIGKIYGQVTKALGNKKTSLYAKSERRGQRRHHRRADAAGPGGRVGLGRGRSRRRGAVPASPGNRAVSTRVHLGGGGPAQAVRDPVCQRAARLPSPSCPPTRQRQRRGGRAGGRSSRRTSPTRCPSSSSSSSRSLGSTSWSSLRWRAVVHQVGNRVGLLLCGDLATAARLVMREGGFSGNGEGTETADLRELARRHEPLRELLRFAVSDNYFALRERLGTAVPSAAAA